MFNSLPQVPLPSHTSTEDLYMLFIAGVMSFTNRSYSLGAAKVVELVQYFSFCLIVVESRY